MGRKDTKKGRSVALSDQILATLRTGDSFVSGETISRHLNITRAALWKKIQILRRSGYMIEAVPSKGYRLRSSPDIPTEEAVHSVFRGKRIGRRIIFHHLVTSTNDVAMEMAHRRDHAAARASRQGLKKGTGRLDGVVITADSQECGRGRLGRSWLSPPGVNLYFTVVLEPFSPPREASLITLMAAVAVASAIREHTGLPAGIKWPNDILIGSRKVAGILAEMKSDTDLIHLLALGIGVNVNMPPRSVPPHLRPNVTSLKEESGRPVNRVGLFGAILSHLEYWYRELSTKGRKTLLSEWRDLNITLGKTVRVKTQKNILSGTAQGISDDGELLVRTSSGRVEKVFSGDVSILKE